MYKGISSEPLCMCWILSKPGNSGLLEPSKKDLKSGFGVRHEAQMEQEKLKWGSERVLQAVVGKSGAQQIHTD